MSEEKYFGSYESKSETRKRQYDVAYMDIAKRWALLSLAKKKQVGAIIVKDRMIISDGFNGTPTGFDNRAEDNDGKTHWYTLHAEANAILKLAASTQNSLGATLYITCAPCRDCAKLIYQSGIKRVVYGEDYKTIDGPEFLKKAGIQVQKFIEIQNNVTNITDTFEPFSAIYLYKAITNIAIQNDFESIDESANILLKNFGNNFDLIKSFLTATNPIKDKLKNRNKIYVKAVQICDMSGFNVNNFLKNLK